MFCDEVTVQFNAGRGGNGCVGFRREKFVPYGGPNGGDAGKGGSLFLMADENINTLSEFNSHKKFKAPYGDNGQGQLMGGLDGEDLILHVPVGTMIYDESKKNLLCDLNRNGDRFLVARGGRGGFGNHHFKSSTRQAPNFAEFGEPGEERICVLELKLVADVGIIGLPSVGKSTLISRISNARPKIAAYHFTTLIPNLGLVNLKEFGGDIQQSFVACDLPGLIEGAHEGKGLGIQFLKHVARNRILVHLLDINSDDPIRDYKTIMGELKAFDKNLVKKPQLLAFNKVETRTKEEVKEAAQALKKKFPKVKKIYTISGVTGEGIKELVFAMWEMLEKEKKAEKKAAPKEEPREGEDGESEEDYKVFRPAEENDSHSFEATFVRSKKDHKIFRVTGRRIEQIVVMTDFSNAEAVARVYDVFEKMQIHRALRREGARFGDEIEVGEHTIIFRWD